MKTDWKEVAETLEDRSSFKVSEAAEYGAAIRLCLLAAELPLGEAERVLEAAIKAHQPCTRCNGKGFEPGGHGSDCRDCHGRGPSPVTRDFPI